MYLVKPAGLLELTGPRGTCQEHSFGGRVVSALPVGRPQRKTFGEFIAAKRPTAATGFTADQARRLRLAGADIDTLTKLQTWARLRWPDWYTRRSGEKYDGPTGKQVMAHLWAGYLAWAEAE